MRVLNIRSRRDFLTYISYRNLSYFKEEELEYVKLLYPNRSLVPNLPLAIKYTKLATSVSNLNFTYHILDYCTEYNCRNETPHYHIMYSKEFVKKIRNMHSKLTKLHFNIDSIILFE